MSEEGVEETYSTIFSALKHPVRRRIMRMLSVDEELSYTEILNSLGIDSGHLNYHLDSLGELVTKTEGGKYKLSPFGRATVDLMGDIEEVKTREIRVESLRATRDRLMLLLQMVAVCALVIASVTLANVSYTSTYLSYGGTEVELVEYLVQPNGTMHWSGGFTPEFLSDTLTTKYRFFYRIQITSNASLWVQLWEGLYPDGYLLYNATLIGPFKGEGGPAMPDLLIPLRLPKILYGGVALYTVWVKNLGMWMAADGNLPNYTAQFKLKLRYPIIEETNYPYFYFGLVLVALAVVIGVLGPIIFFRMGK